MAGKYQVKNQRENEEKSKEQDMIDEMDRLKKDVEKVKPVLEPYPKQEWMELKADPEIGKVLQVESYETAMLILLWRILKEVKK